MGRLLIVRHGETSWNAEGRIQGHTDVGLSDEGDRQARMVAQRLAKLPIDVAYSSDLSRASETAQWILEKREVALHAIPELRERYYGIFEGLTAEERQHRYPEMFTASLEKDLDFAPTGGESARQTCTRMAALVADLRRRHHEETVLIVGHGGSLRAAIIALMDFPLEATWRFAMANCALSVFDIYPDNAVMCLYNDTSHLDGPGSGL